MKKISKTIPFSGSKPSVVFFGSGPVAANCLKLLLKNFNVEAVVTKPVPAHHRGIFPVLEVCQRYKLNAHTVSDRSQLAQLIKAKPFSSDLAVLIDFGIIVGQTVIDYFKFGIINSHFSLLPQWRGADPITFALLSGQDKTGVTLMLLDQGMDTGKILVQKSIKIEPSETVNSLTDKLIGLSDNLLYESVEKYLTGNLSPREQPHQDRVLYSRKLTKADGYLNFNKPASVLEREIRAFQGWPKSHTTLGGKDVVIIEAYYSKQIGKPGMIFETEAKEIGIGTIAGSVIIKTLQPAGKKPMPASAFLAGNSV